MKARKAQSAWCTFENANILILLKKKDLITEGCVERLLDELDHLCGQITNFQNSLRK